MKHIKVAAGVVNQVPMDWSGNVRRIKDCIEQAREQHATLVLLPELCVTGYGCEDMFFAPELQERARACLDEIAESAQGLVVSVGLPLMYRNALYNTAALIIDGQVKGFAAKQNLAGDGVYYEPRWFAAWPENEVRHVSIKGNDVPIGDLVFDCGELRIGFEICEDGWASDRPGIGHAAAGVDVILNPSASHFAFGKQEVRKRLVLEGSRAFGATYVYTNLLGNESGRIVFDGGVLIASCGSMVAESARLSFEETVVTVAAIDLDETRRQQARTVSTRPGFEEDTGRILSTPFTFPEVPPEKGQKDLLPFSKEEAFGRTVALALFDYLRKSWSAGFMLSLSGGADSSAVACLVGLMVDLGCRELGCEGFRKRLHYIADLQGCKNESEMKAVLLTCVYQRSNNSSENTYESARYLAKWLNATFYCWEIDESVGYYTDVVEKALKRELDWKTDDIAMQNIQARVRAPGVWMLANIKNALLLATSNRSEAAVGYATMDGDTSGGLSPIAGIDKAFLLHWLQWMENNSFDGLPKFAGLKAVNKLQPSAELRPLEQAQTDENDLMPYKMLDAIEREAIRDKKLPQEVLDTLVVDYPSIDRALLIEWIKRFFRLWSRNQWKRERYAPSFHLDDKNLDPKSWCRFPILSSGFREELEQLR